MHHFLVSVYMVWQVDSMEEGGLGLCPHLQVVGAELREAHP